MRGRSAQHALIGLAMVVLAGCPAPTGRHRGEPSEAGTGSCTAATTPVPGGTCYQDIGAVCDAVRPCGLSGSYEIDTCTCDPSGTWTCAPGPCNTPFDDDGGPAMCPGFAVVGGDPCSPRQGGLTCDGTVLDCTGHEMNVSCFCTGSRWSCQSACDAGAPDARDASRDASDAGTDAGEDAADDASEDAAPDDAGGG